MFRRRSRHLTVQSPSPTTVLYTVSNRSLHVPVLFEYLRYVGRILVVIYTLLIDLAKAQASLHGTHISAVGESLLDRMFGSKTIRTIAESSNWWILIVATIVILYLGLRRPYTGE